MTRQRNCRHFFRLVIYLLHCIILFRFFFIIISVVVIVVLPVNWQHTETTSNVTGRHQCPKQKLHAGYRLPSRHRRATCHQSYICLLDDAPHKARHIFYRRVWYRTLSLCYVLHVFNVSASSSPLGYPCAKFRFCRTLSLRKIAYSITHSITQSLTQLI